MLNNVSRRELLQLAGAGALIIKPVSAAQRKGSSDSLRQHIDPEWFRKTLAGETEHWLKAAATPSGFFQVTLDREWQPVGRQTASLVSQGRQIFVMATGYDLTRN